MLGVLIATVVAVVALLGIIVYVLREQASRHARVDRALHDEGTPTLEYLVPTGQDPVVVLAALERAGYAATVDPRHAHQHVLVACPEGVEHQREEVRAVIESASVTAPEDGVPMSVDVRFTDER